MRKCVERLKMRKAPGECGVIPETLQARGDEMVDVVQNGMESRCGPG